MTEKYSFGRFTLSVVERRLEKDGIKVNLGPPSFDILVALLQKGGGIVRGGDLVRIGWPDIVASESLLRVHVATLRRALGETNSAASSVLNVRGEGYRFAQAFTRDAPTSRIELPRAPRTKLVGRKSIVASLSGLLGRSLFLTITGAGGVGKTVVAQEVAEIARFDFRDGIVFLDFGRFPPESDADPSVARENGPAPISDEVSIQNLLPDRQSIFILDGCEHLLSTARHVALTIRRQSPLSAIIVTSREALGMEHENVRALEPLDFAGQLYDAGRDLLSYPAAQLFFDRACANVGSFVIDEEIATEIGGLCRLLEGNPLALELAAMRIDHFGIIGLADRIKLDVGVLSGGKRTAHDRQKSMINSLEWSLDLLNADQKLAMRALAFFSGSFSLASARSVLANNGSLDERPEDLIEGLMSKSLLSLDRSSSSSRYRMSYLVRAIMQMSPRAAKPPAGVSGS